MTKPQKPKMIKISWKAIVEKRDPERHKKKVTYEFSNGRKFYDKGR